jgi:hypothetical protein
MLLKRIVLLICVTAIIHLYLTVAQLMHLYIIDLDVQCLELINGGNYYENISV